MRAQRPVSVARARWRFASLLGAALVVALPVRADEGVTLPACRVTGIPYTVLCGHVARPLDPTHPAAGPTIDVHYMVVPAKGRRKLPDPVFLLAGGPGQSAISAAPAMLPWFVRLNNRRDLVFVDQRGTGRSAPLSCDDEGRLRLAERSEPAKQLQRLRECRDRLAKLPHGDLRQYTTAIAMLDVDAVRQQLGAARINLVGFSYGTRAALDYLRQFPSAVRRAVLDGVAPPDMALPASHSTDGQAALDALFVSCERESGCAKRYPTLRADWHKVLNKLPFEVTISDPLTGRPEIVSLHRTMLLQAVRAPLYASVFASALPHAISEATHGRMQALAGLSSLFGSRKGDAVAMGMHFSVICAEDVPLLADAGDRPGADFGDDFARLYQRTCEGWPRGTVPQEFYRVPVSRAPVLLLSGAVDPVTPPRHGERIGRALGANSRHVIVPNAGHNVLALGCMRDVTFRFIDAGDAQGALAVDASCAAQLPRPPAFEPVQ